MHVSDEVIGWDGYGDLLMAALPVEFCMPDIERFHGDRVPPYSLTVV